MRGAWITGRLKLWGVSLAVLLSAASMEAQAGVGRIQRAYIGGDGLVHIVDEAGREFVAAREKNPLREMRDEPDSQQESVSDLKVAADGGTVGWLVNFGNSSTSDPIPLVLVVYRDGHVRRLHPSHAPPAIFAWNFVGDGEKVSFYSDTLHGGLGASCELHDVKTGRLLDSWPIRKATVAPEWVKAFGGSCDPDDTDQ
jgi:hypothetical protein